MNLQTEYTKQLSKELTSLYRKWPDIKRFMKTLGCDPVTAEDLFQEALLIYNRKSQSPDFELTAEPFFYVRNTCKLLWYNLARKEQKQATFALEKEVESIQDEWLEKELKLVQVEVALKKLGQQCQEILQLFYGLGWSMIDIAAKIGLRNDKVAKVQKYRCLQKAKELVKENSIQVESLNI